LYGSQLGPGVSDHKQGRHHDGGRFIAESGIRYSRLYLYGDGYKPRHGNVEWQRELSIWHCLAWYGDSRERKGYHHYIVEHAGESFDYRQLYWRCEQHGEHFARADAGHK